MKLIDAVPWFTIYETNLILKKPVKKP